MEQLKKYTPLFVAGFIIAVGAVKFVAATFDPILFKAEPPGKYVIMAIAVLFVMLGLFFVHQFRRGQLKRRGETLAEVRMKAVEKMIDKPLLTTIAENDPIPAVRRKAVQRLKELAD